MTAPICKAKRIFNVDLDQNGQQDKIELEIKNDKILISAYLNGSKNSINLDRGQFRTNTLFSCISARVLIPFNESSKDKNQAPVTNNLLILDDQTFNLDTLYLESTGLKSMSDLFSLFKNGSLTPLEQQILKEQTKIIASSDPNGKSLDQIDTNRKLYAMMVLLNNQYGSKLNQPFDLENIRELRKEIEQVHFQNQAFNFFGVSEGGADLAAASIEFSEAFKPHFDHNKQNILNAAQKVIGSHPGIGSEDVSKRPLIVIPGAGGCSDIPLLELAKKYRVVLVDIDEERMKKAIDSLPEVLKKYVSYEVRDASGGVVIDLMTKVNKIIEDNTDDIKAAFQIRDLLGEAKIPTPALAGEWQPDFIASSLLIIQIPAIFTNSVNVLFRKKFTQSFTTYTGVSKALEKLSARLVKAHIKALGDIVRLNPRAGVYLASDLYSKGYKKEDGVEKVVANEATTPLNAFRGIFSIPGDDHESMTEFLDFDSYFNYFLLKDLTKGIEVTHYDPWEWTVVPYETVPNLPNSKEARVVDAVLFTSSEKPSFMKSYGCSK